MYRNDVFWWRNLPGFDKARRRPHRFRCGGGGGAGGQVPPAPPWRLCLGCGPRLQHRLRLAAPQAGGVCGGSGRRGAAAPAPTRRAAGSPAPRTAHGRQRRGPAGPSGPAPPPTWAARGTLALRVVQLGTQTGAGEAIELQALVLQWGGTIRHTPARRRHGGAPITSPFPLGCRFLNPPTARAALAAAPHAFCLQRPSLAGPPPVVQEHAWAPGRGTPGVDQAEAQQH